MDFGELREIEKKELSTSLPTQLPENFYDIVKELLEEKRKEAVVTCSIDAVKEYENIKKTVKIISQKREEKIILLALRGQEAEGLTREERELWEKVQEAVGKMREKVERFLESEVRVKIIKPVAQYKGMDNKLYGPFNVGEEKVLPSQEAKLLLEAGLAELIK